jgi:hypothetical protein
VKTNRKDFDTISNENKDTLNIRETKLRIHNITAKAALKYGSEAWVLKKREKQRS